MQRQFVLAGLVLLGAVMAAPTSAQDLSAAPASPQSATETISVNAG